jgi:polyhydroxyalkanoate synthesis regulator phasin
MRLMNRKLALGIAGGALSVGLFSAVAFASFAPDSAVAVNSLLGPSSAVLADETKHDKLKDILDGLVAKGVITQAQEDAILAALRDAAGTRIKHVEAVVHDFLHEAAQFLGLSDAQLRERLPGTSLAALATDLGKSRDGLVADLVNVGKADIDKALADKKITEDQAKKLREELPERVAKFVDRTWPKKHAAGAPHRANVKEFVGDLLKTGQAYLGLSADDIRGRLASGASLGAIADSLSGKSRAELIATLTNAANARIDAAVADHKLTADQATTLKAKVATDITSFVDRKWTLPTVKRPTPPTGGAPVSPTNPPPTPKEGRD